MAIKPKGARIFVRDIVSSLTIEQRAEAVGLVAIVDETNRPRPTEGLVVAIGNDPFIADFCKVGDKVYFKWSAGTFIQDGGEQLRSLEIGEIEGVDDGT